MAQICRKSDGTLCLYQYCPKCGRESKRAASVKPEGLGTIHRCPDCGTRFKIVNDGDMHSPCAIDETGYTDMEKIYGPISEERKSKINCHCLKEEQLMPCEREYYRQVEANFIQMCADSVDERSQLRAEADKSPCPWCGELKQTSARFCPHCRLDSVGRAADRGPWDITFHRKGW
jgi:predicted RNA-binding Zn-ribbon protein involved in translation (DUF1610 family)